MQISRAVVLYFLVSVLVGVLLYPYLFAAKPPAREAQVQTCAENASVGYPVNP